MLLLMRTRISDAKMVVLKLLRAQGKWGDGILERSPTLSMRLEADMSVNDLTC